MAKIVTLQEGKSFSLLLKKQKRTLILTGGCFDILHIGHIKFLEEAKKTADALMILLESDRKVIKLKGNSRPFFTQEERAYALSSLSFVDFIITLPYLNTDKEYSDIIMSLKPNFIAATAKDPLLEMKKRQSQMIGGKLIIVPYIKTFSSSKLAKIIGID